MDPFWPKTGQKFRNFYSSCHIFTTIIFWLHTKKSENVNGSIVRKFAKTLFQGKFGPNLAQKWPKKILKKVYCRHILTSIIHRLHVKIQKIWVFQRGESSDKRPKKTHSPFNSCYFLPSCKNKKNLINKVRENRNQKKLFGPKVRHYGLIQVKK